MSQSAEKNRFPWIQEIRRSASEYNMTNKFSNVLSNIGFDAFNHKDEINHIDMLNSYSPKILEESWNQFSNLIKKNYEAGKGTIIKGFGTFTFINPEYNFKGKINQYKRDIQLRRPVFIVSNKFLNFLKPGQYIKRGELIYPSLIQNNKIILVKFNYTELAFALNVSKEECQNIIATILKEMGESIINRQFKSKELPGLGIILIRANILAVKFFSDFNLGKYKQTDKLNFTKNNLELYMNVHKTDQTQPDILNEEKSFKELYPKDSADTHLMNGSDISLQKNLIIQSNEYNGNEEIQKNFNKIDNYDKIQKYKGNKFFKGPSNNILKFILLLIKIMKIKINNNIVNKDNNNSSNENFAITEIKVNKKKNISSKEQIIEAKIKELNEETEKFKEERNKVTFLKNEYEKLSEKLMNDIEEFNIKKEEFEKYKQSEMENIKNKKMLLNQLPSMTSESNNKIISSLKNQNQTLLQNSKKDKETIKSLKLKIFDLENIIKQKDNEIKKIKSNNNSTLKNKKELLDNNSIALSVNKDLIDSNVINISKKNILDKKLKVNGQINNKKIKNMKSNREIKIEVKNLFEKKMNNDLLDKNKDKNNYTISNNFSKMYFDNINKNIMKINHSNNSNISFTQTQKPRNIKKKLTSNYNDQNWNKKVNTSGINKVIHTKRINNNNEYKLSDMDYTTFNNRNGIKNKMIISFTERSSSSKKIDFPKIKLDYQDGMSKVLDLEDNDNDSNVNYNTCYAENNIFKNITKIPILRKSINNLLISTNSEKNSNSISDSKKIRINKSKGEFRIKINRKEKNKIINVNNLKEKINKNIVNNYDIKDKKVDKKSKAYIDEYVNKENNNNIQNNNDNNLDFVIINNDNSNENANETNIEDKDKEDINKYDFIIPDKYSYNSGELLNTVNADGKIIKIYSNNKKEINFKSGVKKEIFGDGHQLVHFPNGDMKQHFPDGKIVYYFNDAKTVQTTYPDGLNVFKFNNNQVEKHYPDGSKFIIYPDGTKRKIAKEDNEDNYFSDDEDQINQKNDKKYNTVEFNF